MRRSSTSLAVRVVMTALLATCLALPAPAFAALEDQPKLESSTNPNVPNGDVWWRDGWGNDAYPHLLISNIPKDLTVDGDQIETLGIYYWITRGSVPDTSTMPPLNASIDTDGAMHDQTFDLAGMYADESLDLQGPGSVEGLWTIWFSFYNRNRTSNIAWGTTMGYDATPPGSISGLTASATSAGAASESWTETSRRYVRWSPAVDLLSGIGVYRYELNGKVIGYHPGELPGQWMSTPLLTLESLPPGKNKITITPVDRATNEGPSSTVYAYVDTDQPVVSLSAPTAATIGASPRIKASAKDAAGVRSVKFYVNDKLVYTDTAAPYEVKPSLSGYAHGTRLTVKAVAEDMFGHKVTASKSYKLDKNAPSITRIGDSPDPFYPILSDGYKDKSKLAFSLGEKSTVTLRVYNRKGKLIREIVTSRDKGRKSVKWDGKDSSGNVRTGTFYLKLLARDAAGNIRATKKYATHIKDYEIVRVSRSSVRVVPR